MKLIEVSDQFYEKLDNARKQTDHATLEGFIKELFHNWDKDIAVEEGCKDLQKQMDNLVKQQKDTIASHKGSLNGLVVEKYLPYLDEYSRQYNLNDIISVGYKNPFDMIVLNGLNSTNKINKIVFQEIKTSINAKKIPNDHEGAVMDFIDNLHCPSIIYEHWAKTDTDTIFHIVNHRHNKRKA